jgi:hypothetical protein
LSLWVSTGTSPSVVAQALKRLVDARYHWIVDHDVSLRSSVEEALADLEALEVESSDVAREVKYTRDLLADPVRRTTFGPAWAMLCECAANASHNLGFS